MRLRTCFFLSPSQDPWWTLFPKNSRRTTIILMRQLQQEYLKMLEEAKEYDHRELTKKREIFFFYSLSPGSCFFLPHGARVCNKLLEFIKSQYWNRGYEEDKVLSTMGYEVVQ